MVENGLKIQNSLNMLEKVYVSILLVIFGGIVLHAPISVGLGTLFPDYSLLIKSWKEILMVIAGLIVLALLYRKKRFKLLRDPLIVVIGLYGLLHVLLALFLFDYLNINQILAGLAIDLRYILFFSLVYLAIKLYPKYYKLFIKVGIVGALVVLVFAMLQVFVLPIDVLKYIGYGKNTIVPYLTVDQNYDFIRINSTLRGPNPLGAYAVIVLALVLSGLTRRGIDKSKITAYLTALLLAGGLVALWFSYSRSALGGFVIAMVLVFALTNMRKSPTKMLAIGGVILIAISGILFIARDTSFVSNVLLHESPTGGSAISSNEEHAFSIKSGIEALLYQPIGDGIGSAGSASLYGSDPLIIENQYLFVAHETGWFGIILFFSIFMAVIIKLWDYRKNWLAVGVFASGIGLAAIGLLLPVWVDDTVSIVWWGLAGVVLGYGAKNKII
jgi:hypothetical protein